MRSSLCAPEPPPEYPPEPAPKLTENAPKKKAQKIAQRGSPSNCSLGSKASLHWAQAYAPGAEERNDGRMTKISHLLSNHLRGVREQRRQPTPKFTEDGKKKKLGFACAISRTTWELGGIQGVALQSQQ